MKKTFSASVVQEGEWYVAQCLEVDVASQGATEAEALANLREASVLTFEEPRPTEAPRIEQIEVVAREWIETARELGRAVP